MDKKKFWIREFLANKNATVQHVETKNNLADIFTKYVPNTVLERLRSPIMGRGDPPRSDESERKTKTKAGNTKKNNVMSCTLLAKPRCFTMCIR